MRLIGHLSEEQAALTFSNYLYSQGIENQMDHAQDGWGLWVHDEDQLHTAAAELTAFRANPNDPKFRAGAENAAGMRKKASTDQAAHEKRLKQRRHLFRPLGIYSFGPVTFALIAISVVVFLATHLGGDVEPVHMLFISERPGFLSEVKHGEVWRLVTPIFLHFSILHILFNSMWLKDLGSMIEARQSSWYFALLVIGLAAASNFIQYFFRGPHFGGLSGVVYGLIGYIWLRGKTDPGSGLYLHPYTVNTALIWLVICFTGLVGPVANMAHLGGLAAGALWGWLSSLRYR